MDTPEKRAAFFNAIRPSLFDGSISQQQVDGINSLLLAWEEWGNRNNKHFAYILASVYHETGRRMVPVREGFASSDQSARRIVANRRYGKEINGQVYYGRGQIQLTWLENYKKCSPDAGVDLVSNPNLALNNDIGARIAVRGILDGRFNGQGHGIGYYLTDTGDDLKNARRTVNVTDRWEMIAGYYQKFLDALGGYEKPQEAPEVPEWVENAKRLAAWRAAAPEGAIEWLMEIPDDMGNSR